MQVAEIRQLVRWLDEAGLAEFELDGPGVSLRLVLRRSESDSTAPELMVSPSDLDESVSGHVVTAPVAGILRLQHPYATEPLAELGGEVAAGAVIALLQIGSICAPVTAPTSGVVGRIRALPDSLVGFGAPLFEIFEIAEGA